MPLTNPVYATRLFKATAPYALVNPLVLAHELAVASASGMLIDFDSENLGDAMLFAQSPQGSDFWLKINRTVRANKEVGALMHRVEELPV